VATLSRDAANANNSISPIFDKEKEQKRLQTAQLVGEIAGQAMDIVRTEGSIRATSAGKAELAKKGVQEPGEKASKEDWKTYNDALVNSESYQTTQKQFVPAALFSRVCRQQRRQYRVYWQAMYRARLQELRPLTWQS